MAAKLTALQFFFALTWVVYVVYLPALAEQAGIGRRYVPWILMMDQAIFIACDWAAGAYADRLARAFGRVGPWMAGVALASCVAFLAMPFAAPIAGPAVFLALAAVWSATSAALRAPPLVIASRYAEADRRPWFSSCYLLGLGLAAAMAPFLGIALRGIDPRIPFAAASLGVAVFAYVAARMEAGSPASAHEGPAVQGTGAPGIALFAVAILCFGVGLQIHIAINSAPAYLRFAPQASLMTLLPVFWVGFSLAVLPAALLPRRFGGLRTMALAGLVGAVALFGVGKAQGLEILVAAQLVAGAAWGVALSAAVTAAIEAGQPDRAGLVTGLLFSMLAGAALARLAVTSMGLPAQAGLGIAPVVGWIGAAAIAGWLAARAGGKLRPGPRG